MDKHTGAFIGASLMSFLPGVPARQRESVMLAMAMVVRDTDDALKAGFIEVQDRLTYLRNKLRFYGWDAVPPEQAHWPSAERPHIVDQALRTICAQGGEHFADATQRAIERLTANPHLLLQFESQARQRGCYQLLPCASSSSTRVDMVIYDETASQSVFTGGFLSRARGRQNVWAQLVRFNTLHFDQTFRAKMTPNLQDVALARVSRYEIR